MKINEISFLDLIPQRWREDKSIKGFARAFDYALSVICGKMGLADLFDSLNMLNDSQMDSMAAAIDIPWYDTSFKKDVKRDILKHYIEAYHKAATAAGIEQTLSYIYGNAVVMEWYEYGGKQFHFKVIVSRVADEESMKMAAKTIKRIKPAVAVLDAIEERAVGTAYVYAPCKARQIIQHIKVVA